MSLQNETKEIDFYEYLPIKAKEIAPKIEILLNGLSYIEAKEMMFSILEKIKSFSLISI